MAKYIGPKNKLYKHIDLNLIRIINRKDILSNIKDNLNSTNKEKKELNINNKKKILKSTNYSKHKISDFKLRLLEKQKVRRLYGIYEKQFLNYYKIALKSKINTGEKLIQLLESRLDNTVYRLGLALNRNLARQLIVHKHILVNNNYINIPSYQISINDKISFICKSNILINQAKMIINSFEIVNWLEIDINKLEGKIKYLPTKKDLPKDIEIKEQLIIEFYAK